MHTSEQEKKTIEFGFNYIKEPIEQIIENENTAKINYIHLINIIQLADKKYYIEDNPIYSDFEYDNLFKKLIDIENKFPNFLNPASPTQRVANGLSLLFSNVEHLLPMLSLENSYNAEDILDWDRKCKELSGENILEYCIEPKFDGTSISLVYENGLLNRAITRGNGIIGDDVTQNVKQIYSVPLVANDGKMSELELRGEILIDKKRFLEINKVIEKEGGIPYANPRNLASGTLRLKDFKEVKKRNLSLFVYGIGHFNQSKVWNDKPIFNTHYEGLKYLKNLGFNTSHSSTQVFFKIHDVINYVQEFEQKRDDLPYEIDGMVIKVNRLDLQEKIGQTSHHPKWAIAFKFKARQATSKLLNVEYQVGRTGSITPVAKIEPVAVGGVTISSLSMFNEEVIKEKQLMIGDTVLIERAGDVIPNIVKSFPELRTGIEQEIIFPKTCPVCNETLYKPEGEAVWRCTNINCEAQVIEKIAHYASKDAMDIRGLGDALVRRFYEQGFLKNIVGIYHLPFEEIKSLEGFGEKSMINLKEAIEKSKTQPLNRLIFGLGIRYVGETTAKALARTVSHLTDLYHKTKEDLILIEDVGEKVATSIVEFFSHHDNREILEALEKEGVCLANTQKNEAMSGGLVGKTFLFTGTMTMKRSEAESLVEKNGGSILGSVSTKLNYLVVGEDAGSKLDKAKKLGTITILSEEEFMGLVF